MKEYTLKHFIKTFGKSICVVIIFALIGAVAMGLDAKHKKSTTYTASRDIVIAHNITREFENSNNNNNDSLVAEDTNMMPTYKDIAKNRVIAVAAHKNLSKRDRAKYSVDDVNGAIDAEITPQSLVMKLKAQSGSAKESIAIANATAKAMKQKLPSLQPGAGRVTLLQKASSSDVTSKTTPSTKKYAVVGLALGGLLGIIVSFVVVTIKNFVK